MEGRNAGVAYEYAEVLAPPADDSPRSGIVMVVRSLAGGGAERIVAMICRAFREQEPQEDLRLWLFSKTESGAGDPLFYLSLAGLAEYELCILSDESTSSEPFRRLPWEFAARAQNIYDELVRKRPRVVYLTLDHAIIAGGIAAMMAGVPKIILHAHNMSPPHLYGDTLRTVGWDRACRVLLSRPNVHFINVAQSALEDYLRWSNASVVPCSVSVVHPGVDFAALDQHPNSNLHLRLRSELGIPLHSPVIGTAMRFSPEKQPITWLKAAALIKKRIKNAHFIMFGDGRMLPMCRGYVRQLGLWDCVHFPGRTHDLLLKLPSLDVLMLSSRSEALPNVLLEAQATGVVPIAFDVGGCREALVPGVTGALVEPNNVEALASEVTRIVQDRRRLAEMKRAGIAFSRQNFPAERMISHLRRIVYSEQ